MRRPGRIRIRAGLWLLAFLAPLLCLPSPARAAGDRWTIEFFIGIPFHFPAPLAIRQSDKEDIRLTARYTSKPFDRPIYYGWRVGNWRGDNGWDLEFVHDKLYLSGKPDDVQAFSISHGFNLLTLSRSRERGGIVERLGAGVVITHPESTIRGKRFPEEGGILNRGYYLSGPAVQVAAGKQLRIQDDFFVPAEGKASASFVRIPVAEGDADVTSLSLHGTLGLGYGR